MRERGKDEGIVKEAFPVGDGRGGGDTHGWGRREKPWSGERRLPS